MHSKSATGKKLPQSMNDGEAGVWGDGEHDDTAGIQKLLDSGAALVYLPPPSRLYLTSRTLLLHSNQELRLDRFTTIRLAPGSNCSMLANASQDDGDENISLSGGVWDMDNARQSPNPYLDHDYNDDNLKYDPALHIGVLLRFVNVKGFRMNSLTLRNPSSFSAQFAKLEHFAIDDISFEQTAWNPYPGNMDGIHIDGACRFGRISNLRGKTYDDLLALNADDCAFESPCFGPIEDILIDGIFAEGAHSAVRLLSTGSPVRRVSIRNVHGSFYRYAIGFTHYFQGRAARGVFDDVSLENLHISKALPPGSDMRYPLVFFENGIDASRIRIRDFHRDESLVSLPSVEAEAGASIESLTMENCSVLNRTAEPIDLFVNYGDIGVLDISNLALKQNEGTPSGALLLDFGKIRDLREGAQLAACAAPFRLGAGRLIPRAGGWILIQPVINCSNKPLEGCLSIDGTARKSLSIPARSSQNLELPGDVKTVSVDASSGTWPLAIPTYGNAKVHVASRGAAGPLEPLRGKQGDTLAKASFECRWDEKTLRLSFVVEDHFPSGAPRNRMAWEQDCVELFFDPEPWRFDGDPAKYNDKIARMFALPYASQEERVSTLPAKGLPKFRKEAIGLRIEIAPSGYIAKIEIPFDILGIAKPQAGACIGFEAQIDDADEKRLLGSITWNSSGGAFQNRLSFGFIELK